MSLFEKRVEAAAEVLLRDYQSEYDGGEVSEFLDVARAVLEAADAVVTVEQIEKAVIEHSRLGDEIDGTYYCACGGGDAGTAFHIAESVLALFRGGAK